MFIPRNISADSFLKGLVFGIDVGTGSIGWAVRRGDEFLDVGVLICPEEIAKMDGRRSLRRQRRTLRSKKYRRQWLAAELEKLGLPKPGGHNDDPIALRAKALRGEELTAGQLHFALAHLFRRRGYTPVPWSTRDADDGVEGEKKKEEGQIREAVLQIRQKMNAAGCNYPAEYLAKIKTEVGPSPSAPWSRKIYWPRDLLEKEFRAIVEAQRAKFPKLAEKTNWLLYGDTQKVRKHGHEYRVFFSNSEAQNPGVLGLRWPRFENRGPALDALRPVDAEGRPLHVVRKNKQAFQASQWELAVMNFRVVDRNTGATVAPDANALARLREMWESSRRKPSKKKAGAAARAASADNKPAAPVRVEIKLSLLQKWEREFGDRYKLIDRQQPLTPQTGAGRARYASPTLNLIREQLEKGVRFDPPQPVLQRDGESPAQALNRYLSDIKHPLVRHRLLIFSRLLEKLTKKHGQPDMLILEAVRSLALSEKNKRELQKRNKQNQEERANVRAELASRGASTSRNALLRYRLWKEASCTCPFCGDKITQEQLLNHEADIEHLVPRSVVDCNEFYNLTVGHIHCNREVKGDKTPFQAFSHTDRWPQLRDNAEKCFKGRKLEIFLSDKAEELIEQKADLQHTAYIARVIRHVALLKLGWVGKDGRDPTIEKGNTASSCFQVTNGQLTSRLRQSWGLNQILHPLPPGKRFEDLTDAEKQQQQQKNRGDLRHHALDAMVIACTLPWLAHRTHGATDALGRRGWWFLDEKQRSKAANPIFPREGQMHDVVKAQIGKVVVQHHVSRSPHQSAYATTVYGKKAPNTYVAREVFTSLTPKNLGSIWPPEFSAYCQAAWSRYESEAADLATELKQSKGCVPQRFTSRLCFAHFQQWRERAKAGADAAFDWPEEVRIPICSVKLISVKDDTAVAPASPGTPGFVKRTGFKEVRIHHAKDGKRFVPVFVPYWKNDKPIADGEFVGQPIAVIRRGETVNLRKATGPKNPPGIYRVSTTMQDNIQLIPSHLAKDKESLLASGFLANGVTISWKSFLSAAGYELPHTASAQPEPPGAAEAGPVAH